MTAPRKRFDRDDWLTLGLDLLSAEGPDALRIDKVCAEAGLTKGSFYHHFADQATFLEALVDHWRAVQTDNPIADFDLGQFDAEAFERIVQEMIALDMHLELNIRKLAARDPALAAKVAATDAARLSFTARIYEMRFGVDPEMAQDIALLDYGAFSGIVMLRPDISLEDRIRLYTIFDDMLKARFAEPEFRRKIAPRPCSP